jgi:hypothetical protein
MRHMRAVRSIMRAWLINMHFHMHVVDMHLIVRSRYTA